jgi:homoserine O-succinyltransferase/O-acetyltransferase
MFTQERKTVRVAILDLYEGHANEGMRCIRQILREFADANNFDLVLEEFDVRLKNQVPSLHFDLYISSGGPGSPLESEGSEWEKVYFQWLHQVKRHNDDAANNIKKHVLFICHSFQLVCRHLKIAHVTKRKSTAFGVFPVHLLNDGKNETLFHGLEDPFYAVDSRDYQVVQPNHNLLHKIGGQLLAIEKERPHVPLERAIMAVRFNEYMIGTQFHPEADAVGMSMYLQREDKKKTVVENYGQEKWESMIDHLNDPDKILWTYSHIIPNFLQLATQQLIGVHA